MSIVDGVPDGVLFRSPLVWAMAAFVVLAVYVVLDGAVVSPIRRHRARRARRETAAGLGLQSVPQGEEWLATLLASGVFGVERGAFGQNLYGGSASQVSKGSYRGHDVWCLDWREKSSDSRTGGVIIVKLRRPYPALLIERRGLGIMSTIGGLLDSRFKAVPTGHAGLDAKFTVTASREDPEVLATVSRIRETLLARGDRGETWRVAETMLIMSREPIAARDLQEALDAAVDVAARLA